MSSMSRGRRQVENPEARLKVKCKLMESLRWSWRLSSQVARAGSAKRASIPWLSSVIPGLIAVMVSSS